MTDVLIPFAGAFLALTPEQLGEALQRGRDLMPTVATPPAPANAPTDEIFDADGMEAKTGVPASWWLEQARLKTIPHIRAGKYVRFRLAETLAALQRRPSSTDPRSDAGRGRPVGSVPYRRRARPATSSGSTLASKPLAV